MSTETTRSRPILRSECGRYYAVSGPSADDHWYRLFDADGHYVGRSGYWGNRSTSARIGFEVGMGELTVAFSYPRWPRWFRKRWVEIDCGRDGVWRVWTDTVSHLIKMHGAEPLGVWKPDMSLWVHAGFQATTEQLQAIDNDMQFNGWNFRLRQPHCGRDIDCPSSARTWPRYRVTLQWPEDQAILEPAQGPAASEEILS